MRLIFFKNHVQATSKPVIAWLALLVLLGAVGPVIAACGNGGAGGHPAARSASSRQTVPKRQGVRSPATITVSGARCNVGFLRSSLHLSGVRVDSATMKAKPGSPSYCDVNLTKTDRTGTPSHIVIWLPRSWNGRFQGVGGAIYACGPFYYEMSPAIQRGYAVAATDCGVSPADRETASWALKGGKLNWPVIRDYAYAGIHDMTVAGKAVTSAYYPAPLRFSYFNGCSTGGREGLVEAQRYPADYNGIVSGAPAINWTRFIPAEIWPQLVMNRSRDFLPACKEAAFASAAVHACGTRGVIANPSACQWNAGKLAGVRTPCGVITQQDADVMNKIWQGPRDASGKRLWYGAERGTSLSAGLGATIAGMDGQPFPIPVSWLGTWLQRNPSWDWHTLTYAKFDQLFRQSVSEFSGTFAANNPDLSAFRKDGSKIIIWHGLSDQLIFPQGTVKYYQRMQRAMGGARRVTSFARLFLAPGAEHCASGAGAAPAMPGQPLDSLTRWVETGKAPTTIPGAVTDPATNQVTQTRPLCLYPRTARYAGHGSLAVASSYVCESR